MRIISTRSTLALLVLAPIAAHLSTAADKKAEAGVFEQQLRSQYTFAKTGHFGKVSAAGTTVVIQQEGLNSCPAAATMWYMNIFKDGQRQRRGMREAMYANSGNLRTVEVGEKFYISKLEVKDNAVIFYLNAPETSNGKAAVFFQFAKGYQTSVAFSDIQQAIAKVFTLEGQNENSQQPAEVAAQPAAPAAPTAAVIPPAPPVPPADPVKIELGQTTEQVVAAMGQPEKMVNLGEKQIYMYKDLKITFLNGKVSDVQ
jgi:hypothetical protein